MEKAPVMLPILPSYSNSYHPSSDWASQLVAKQALWQTRQTAGHPVIEPVTTWTLNEWVVTELQFDAPHLDREQVLAWLTVTDQSQLAEPIQHEAVNLFRAVNAIAQRAKTLPATERDALGKEDLIHSYRLLTGNPVSEWNELFRRTEAVPQVPTHQPAAPHALPILVEMALDWFTTDSFAEMHPVEKASLFHLRMLDLQPFASHTNRLVRLLTSYYLLRDGLPPLMIAAHNQQAYFDTLGFSFQMITQPGVELFARLLEQTLDQWLEMTK
ncbi:MAG TPA: Fic family protein [Acidobacteriota bacterium]|nr:Fic family protein [Acidobacteriota bacterium]HNB70667.1 Fic family protein [Acidobacteriota bacterium]HNC44758.1 Fic family protein [Acidobacteriota bacterium]HND18055.1 Fic family protein [Acidobacteriota bacterium]HNG94760.1 Fic family protein [Acidobacteriota bacterium]